MWTRLPIAGKLALWLVVSTGVIFGVFGALNVRVHRRGAEELVLQSADRICDVIARSTRYQMLHNDRAALYQMVRDIGGEPGIALVRIFNSEGRISFSTNAEEVGRIVDKQAESCYVCHSQTEPLAKLDRPDRARIFPAERGGVGQGRRILAVIRPIDNEDSCSQAACHAHPPAQRVLGVIDTQLRLDAVDAQSALQRGLLIRSSAAAIVLTCLVSTAFIWIFVHRPLRALRAGTQRIAAGDLRYRLPARSHDELGELVGSFNTMTVRLGGALEASEKMASLGKLAATVAHEVNNPLFGILTYARLGQRALEAGAQASDGRAAEALRIIERESRRCGDIMRNLLTFARQAPSHRSPQALGELVNRAVTLVRHQLEMQGIALEKSIPPDLPLIECDGGQIQQVLLVLLMNAVEAMPKGGTLRVATEYDGAAGEARIVVHDSGPGIPAAIIARIFEPFFTTKEDVHRTGMGLAVARSIVEQHGGSIQVQSRVVEGAEFTVRLPVPVPTRP